MAQTEEKIKQVYTLYIKAGIEKVWDALIKADLTPEWFGGMSVKFEPKIGAKLTYYKTGADGQSLAVVDGEVLEFEPRKRLAYSFKLTEEPKAAADRASRVIYEVESVGELVKLTVIHDEFDGPTATYMGTSQGWPMFLSNLKTLLETGKPLQLPQM